MAFDARLLHDPRLGETDDTLPVDLGEFMNRLFPLALPQTHESRALEIIPWAAVGSPGKWVIAILSHLDAGLARLGQLLADVVQKRGRDAERHRARRGRHCPV